MESWLDGLQWLFRGHVQGFNCALGCLPSYAWLSAVGLLGSMGRMVLQPDELTLTGVVNACEVRLLLLFFFPHGRGVTSD